MEDSKKIYQRYKYKYPPLKEAIFEVKFDSTGFDSAVPGQIYERIRENFPEKKDLKQLVISWGSSEQIPQSPAPVMQAWNKEKNKCIQVGPGIITANDLNYESWDCFLPTIKKILQSVYEVISPETINRVGMRYINRFVIPFENVNVTDYFKIGFAVPPTLTDSNAFNLILHSKKNSIHSKIKFGTDSAHQGEEGVVFILDIDAGVTENISSNAEEIIRIADSAHTNVGAIFEDLLTEKTRELLGREPVC